MKPRPLLRFWHRTRRRPSFWLGLFVACFLAWAWWDSNKNAAGFNARVSGKGLVVGRLNGSTWVFFGPYMGQRWWAYHAPAASVGQWDDEVSAFEANGYRWIRVPDSLVFFSFVGLWGGWLAWRWKRERRMIA